MGTRVEVKCRHPSFTLQNKLYKYFARQLGVKHSALQSVDSDSEAYSRAEQQLDELVSMNMFLDVVGVDPRALPVRGAAVYACICKGLRWIEAHVGKERYSSKEGSRLVKASLGSLGKDTTLFAV